MESMSLLKPTPQAAPHQCPVCHHPQTKIQRKLNDKAHGATNYVCARSGECVLGIDLKKVENWMAV